MGRPFRPGALDISQNAVLWVAYQRPNMYGTASCLRILAKLAKDEAILYRWGW